MATNDFVPFCSTTTGSNLLSQSAYLADPQLPIGNQTGVARSQLVNKALRQATYIASCVAQYLCNITGNNVLDDANQSEVLATMALLWTPKHYFQGYTSGATWSTSTNNVYVDPTASGTPALTQRQASGLTVTTAASSIAGITFTPASATAVYLISAAFNLSTGNAEPMSSQLTDGTTVIAQSPDMLQTPGTTTQLAVAIPPSVYIPGVITPVTVKVQISITNGTISMGAISRGNAIEWTIVRIA